MQPRIPIVFADTETTDLNTATKEIWEHAALRLEPDGRARVAVAMQTAPDLSAANPFSLRVGHFYARHPGFGGDSLNVAGRGDPLPDMLEEPALASHIEEVTRGAAVYGMVPSFEVSGYERLLARHRLCFGGHYQPWDIEAVLAGWLKGRADALGSPVADTLRMPPFDSSELSRAAGIDPGWFARHTAWGDVAWAYTLWRVTEPDAYRPATAEAAESYPRVLVALDEMAAKARAAFAVH